MKTPLNTVVVEKLDNFSEEFKNKVITNNIHCLSEEEISNYLSLKDAGAILISAIEGLDKFKDVNYDTIQALLYKGNQLDYIKEEWYNWRPLHYAAKVADPIKLSLIVAKLEPDQINSLTTLSENALHVLLSHGQSDGFNICFQSGSNFQLSKMLPNSEDTLIECTRQLIAGGIDINHPNFWNETPIVIAIKKKSYNIVRLLLLEEKIDLDNSQESVSGKTPRELLKSKRNQFQVTTKNTPQHKPGRILFHILKSGNEDDFIKFKGGILSDDLVNSVDGVTSKYSSCTLIEYCFRRGLIYWLQEKKKLQDETIDSLDITCHRLVQVFCENGMAKCIQHLIDNSADIKYNFGEKTSSFQTSFLKIAVQKAYYPFLALILGQPKVKFLSSDICNLLSLLLEVEQEYFDFNIILSILLNKLVLIQMSLDANDINVLKKVLQEKVRMVNKENMLLLLNFPGVLCTRRINSEKSILEEIDKEVIKTHLDNCIERKDNKTKINYVCFIDENSRNPINSALKLFLQTPMLHIFFTHPVLKILIKRKWDNLKYRNFKYFKVNFYFYIIFCLILNIYILCKFQRLNYFVEMIFFALNLVFMAVFILKEVAQIWTNRQGYFYEFSNLVEFFFIIVTIMVYVMDINTSWIDIPMVLSVLTSNLVLLLLLEEVPKYARFIIFLPTVAFYLRYIRFYFLQFLAFAICFFILFTQRDNSIMVKNQGIKNTTVTNSSNNIWKELPDRIFQTVLAFTGNFEAVKSDGFKNNEVFSKMIFLLFVVFMAIILNNLLLGLLVTDMETLSEKVKQIQQMKRARFVIRLEEFFPLIRNFGHVVTPLFTQEKKLVVDDYDLKIFGDNQNELLDCILANKCKKQNVFLKLYLHIKDRVSTVSTGGDMCDLCEEMHKELLFYKDKLKTLEEMAEFEKSEKPFFY